MKTLKCFLLSALILVFLTGCSSVRVVSDYDPKVNFGRYTTYAFYKPGIDKAKISDLDKRRILRCIEDEMKARGFVKSETPDILVSLFTTERERVDVYTNTFGWGYGGLYTPWVWGPGWGWGSNVSTRTEGSLYIDLIDAKSRQLVWQGRGTGTLGYANTIEKKEQRIREFVVQILKAYPPGTKP